MELTRQNMLDLNRLIVERLKLRRLLEQMAEAEKPRVAIDAEVSVFYKTEHGADNFHIPDFILQEIVDGGWLKNVAEIQLKVNTKLLKKLGFQPKDDEPLF